MLQAVAQVQGKDDADQRREREQIPEQQAQPVGTQGDEFITCNRQGHRQAVRQSCQVQAASHRHQQQQQFLHAPPGQQDEQCTGVEYGKRRQAIRHSSPRAA